MFLLCGFGFGVVVGVVCVWCWFGWWWYEVVFGEIVEMCIE